MTEDREYLWRGGPLHITLFFLRCGADVLYWYRTRESLPQRAGAPARRGGRSDNPMSTSIPIRVMIVDEHDMVRRGLATVMRLHADLDLVGEAQNGEQAVKLVEQLQPDVVLMDLMMPVMDGATATRIICERWPQVQVIALSASQEQELIQKVLQAGAIGYLLKNLSIDELAEAIRSAHAGQSTLSPEAAQVLNQLNTEQPKPSANA